MTGVGEPDFERLEQYFRALAFSNRLELLHQLREPRPLSEIVLSPRNVRKGENPERMISRQAVQEHLERLMEIGVVVPVDGDGARNRRHFQVNGSKLYQIMEEFRQVGTLVATNPLEREATVLVETPPRTGRMAGPRLVLVHGLLEGKVFPLRRDDLEAGRGWVVGRKADVHVSLEYDPYVSLENSEIVYEDDGWFVEDLRSSRNGTSVNWQRLGRGERAPLAAGDVIGVGRSLLVLVPE